jgi:hypothetical protein
MVLDVLVVGFVLVIWALYALNQKLSDMRSDVKTVKDAAKKWLEKIEREEAADRQARFFEKQAEWDREYDEEAKRRRDTPGCRETRRGVGLRYVLPGEPDYQYSVPLGDSTQAHLVLINAGFVYTMKDDGVGGYVRTRAPGEWIKGVPVPTTEQVETAVATFQSMGFLMRGSANKMELVDSIHEEVVPTAESERHPIAYRLGALVRKIAGRP